MFNCLKLKIYKILYGNIANDVTGILTNNEAYENFKKSQSILEQKNKFKVKSKINSINGCIESTASSGGFLVYYCVDTITDSKDLKFLKQYFKNKGYKVKYKIEKKRIDNNKRFIIIKWDNWDKRKYINWRLYYEKFFI